jgi:AcrR family transcriptional regulator
MAIAVNIDLRARKTPVQERAAVTVESVNEATIQVLMTFGAERLTTTRVAERAGVSVGTLYQYYPNKQALLFAVLEQHLTLVAVAVEKACDESHGLPVRAMMEALVTAFVDAKMRRVEISQALYAVAAQLNSATLVQLVGRRGRKAMGAMLATAPDIDVEDLEFTVTMLFAAMAGATRAVLETGASPKMVRQLRRELVLLGQGYVGTHG